jgi:outer membrane autotransporter protein
MVTKNVGYSALALALGVALTSPRAVAAPARMVVERGSAGTLGPGEVLHVSSPGSTALRVQPRATLDAEDANFVNDGQGSRDARAYGIFVSSGAALSLAGSRVAVSGPWGVGVQAQRDATLELRGTQVTAGGDAGIGVVAQGEVEATFEDLRVHAPGKHGIGILVNGGSRVAATRSQVLAAPAGTALALGAGEVHLRDSVLEAPQGHAIDARFRTGGAARVWLRNSALRGRVESGASGLAIHAEGGSIDGDVSRAGTGELTVRLANGSWRGRGSRVTSLSLDHAAWTLTADSDVAAVRLAPQGRIEFDHARPGFRTLRAGAWHADAGAAGVFLGARLDAGGPLRRQATDRLLVQGDAAGTTTLHVGDIGGGGADTSGPDGTNGPGDGISLAQVAGKASPDSFRLAGDYVVAGPWQYRLQAYEPGRSDPAQRLVGGEGNGYWDFRLQSGGTAAAMPRARARRELAPQVPSYLVLAHAMFGYGRASIDALGSDGTTSSREPALRLRAFGGAARYRAGRGAGAYGIGYLRRDRGLQLAGDMLVHAIGDTTLRTGAALSVGTTRVSPRAVDGRSDARATARGMAWHAVLATERGWQLASAYAYTHYRVDVHTPSRGEVLPRLRANANEAMVSTGYRWRLSEKLVVEPGVSYLWQRVRFSRSRDRDGIDLSAGAPRRTTWRAGARATLALRPEGRLVRAWSPYLDVRHGVARDRGGWVSASGTRLPTARGGRATDVAAGAAFELGARWTASVDAVARLGRGRGNESGCAGRLAAAWSF